MAWKNWCKKAVFGLSKQNGIDWSDPSRGAWHNFVWDDMNPKERNLFRVYYNYYTKVYGNDDYGKFRLFDVLNYAPTWGEILGFAKYDILKTNIGGDLSPIFRNIDDKFGKNSGMTKTFQILPSSNNTISESEFYEKYKNNKSTLGDVKWPYEEEFKLSWMREFVERGVEGLFGPFQSVEQKNSADLYQYEIVNLNSIIDNRNDYKRAMLSTYIAMTKNMWEKSWKTTPYVGAKHDLEEIKRLSDLDNQSVKTGITVTIPGGITLPIAGKKTVNISVLPADADEIGFFVDQTITLHEIKQKKSLLKVAGTPPEASVSCKFKSFNKQTNKMTVEIQSSIGTGTHTKFTLRLLVPFVGTGFALGNRDIVGIHPTYNRSLGNANPGRGVTHGWEAGATVSFSGIIPDPFNYITANDVIEADEPYPTNENDINKKLNVNSWSTRAEPVYGRGRVWYGSNGRVDFWEVYGPTDGIYASSRGGGELDRDGQLSGLPLPFSFKHVKYGEDIPYKPTWAGIEAWWQPLSKYVVYGTMPRIDKNYTIKGWVYIPEIFGYIALPWSFVFAYIDRHGFMLGENWENLGRPKTINDSKNKGYTLIEQLDSRFVALNPESQYRLFVPYGSGTEPSDWWLAANARSRYWHFKWQHPIHVKPSEMLNGVMVYTRGYRTAAIPHRELIYYVRQKNGLSSYVGRRLVGHERAKGDITIPDVARSKEVTNICTYCGGMSDTETDLNYSDGKPPIYQPNNPLHLRSHYLNIFQDIVGWKRYGSGDKHQSPEQKTQTPLYNEEEFIVNDGEKTGYYSINGGFTDRVPYGDIRYNTDILDYKRSLYVNIEPNHLSLAKAIEKEKTDQFYEDMDDRYKSPDSLISTHEAEPNANTSGLNGNNTWYYNHTHNVNITYKDSFNQGLFSPKELQFLYEMVSYVHYGGDDKVPINIVLTAGMGTIASQDRTRGIWELSDKPKHRWQELGTVVSVETDYFNASNAVQYGDSNRLIADINMSTLPSKLYDYILWAAPTYEQYKKIDITGTKDNFLYRFKERFSAVIGENLWNWTRPSMYPFHYMAKNIIDSQRGSRPLVPAWVHMDYISRTINSSNSVPISNQTDSEKYENNERSLGGWKTIDTTVGITDEEDRGTLIALPMFVLGGRPDAPGDWDNSWGANPFTKDPNNPDRIIVGNLDTVLDMWSWGKTHNGKYVSAMEIAFWIRYKRGLAAAPANRTVNHYIDPNLPKIDTKERYKDKTTVFPPQAAITVIERGGNRNDLSVNQENLEHHEILPTETLHNLSILTSYYFPIISDGTDENDFVKLNADPLIEISSPPLIKGDISTSYFGWNSDFCAYWQGADPVLNFERTGETQFITDIAFAVRGKFSGWPANSKISKRSYNSYSLIHSKYRGWEAVVANGYKSHGDRYVTGFDSKKIIKTSDIKSWWRAYKTLKIYDDYLEYIERGLKLEPGEPNSVILTKAKSEGKTKSISDGKYFTTVDNPTEFNVLISGEEIGHRPDDKDLSLKSFSEKYLRLRPWSNYYWLSGQIEATALLDDYSLGYENCQQQFRFMRHMIQPPLFMYFSSKAYDPENGFYSGEQVNKTVTSIMQQYVFHSKVGGEFGTYYESGDSPPSILALKNLGTAYNKDGTVGWTDTDNSGKGAKIMMQSIALEFKAGSSKYNRYNPKQDKYRFSVLTYYVYTNLKKTKDTWNTITKGTFSILGFLSGYGHIVERLPVLGNWFGNRVWGYLAKVDHHTHHSVIGNTEIMLDRIFIGFKFLVNLGVYGVDDWTPYIFLAVDIGAHYATITIAPALAHAVVGAVEAYVAEGLMSQGLAGTLVGLTEAAVIIVIAAIAHQAQKFWENKEYEGKLDKIWEKLNQATEQGYVEGVYLESEGKIKIKKYNGVIPIASDKSAQASYKKTKEEEKLPTAAELRTSADSRKKLEEIIQQKNDEFYIEGGTASKIIKNLKECDCDFFEELIEPINKGNPREHINWDKKTFRRDWGYQLEDGSFNRRPILDEAPDWTDMQISFIRAPKPNYETYWYADSPSTQRGTNQSRNDSTQVRIYGQNGTIPLQQEDGRCPRFWWPSTLISRSTNICDFMARERNGKMTYPLKEPQYFSGCVQQPIGESKQTITVVMKKFGAPNPLGGQQSIGLDTIVRTTAGRDNLAAMTMYDAIIPTLADDLVIEPNSFRARGSSQRVIETLGGPTWDRYYPGSDIIYITYSKLSVSFKEKNHYSWSSLKLTPLLTDKHSDDIRAIAGILDGDMGLGAQSNQNAVSNNVVFRGNTILNAQGVIGTAPPIEREIIYLFRQKYNIAQPSPVNGCCDLLQVYKSEDLEKIADDSSRNQFINEEEFKKRGIRNCTYMIKLNDERFTKPLIEKCKKLRNKQNETSENYPPKKDDFIPPGIQIRDEEVIIANIPAPKNPELFPGGWPDPNNCYDPTKHIYPYITNCTNCPSPCPPRTTTSQVTLMEMVDCDKEIQIPVGELRRGLVVGRGLGRATTGAFFHLITYIIPDRILTGFDVKKRITKSGIVIAGTDVFDPITGKFLRREIFPEDQQLADITVYEETEYISIYGNKPNRVEKSELGSFTVPYNYMGQALRLYEKEMMERYRNRNKVVWI